MIETEETSVKELVLKVQKQIEDLTQLKNEVQLLFKFFSNNHLNNCSLHSFYELECLCYKTDVTEEFFSHEKLVNLQAKIKLCLSFLLLMHDSQN